MDFYYRRCIQCVLRHGSAVEKRYRASEVCRIVSRIVIAIAAAVVLSIG